MLNMNLQFFAHKKGVGSTKTSCKKLLVFLQSKRKKS